MYNDALSQTFVRRASEPTPSHPPIKPSSTKHSANTTSASSTIRTAVFVGRIIIIIIIIIGIRERHRSKTMVSSSTSSMTVVVTTFPMTIVRLGRRSARARREKDRKKGGERAAAAVLREAVDTTAPRRAPPIRSSAMTTVIARCWRMTSCLKVRKWRRSVGQWPAMEKKSDIQ